MITICKNCGSALDETIEACRDCGSPNPWFDHALESASPNDRSGLSDMLIGLFVDNSHVERTLLLLGGINISFVLIALLSLTATPWSKIPVSTRLVDVGALIFGVGDFAVAFYGDPERPLWHALAKGILVANLLGFALVMVLDRGGRL